MSNYSFNQLEALWTAAGGSKASAPTAAAVALAESAGNPSIQNQQGANVWGLWQINLSAHPQYSLASVLNPLGNAKAAVAISNNGANWKPWQTYTNGAYKTFLSAATGQFLPGAPTLPTVAVGTSIVNTITSIPDAIKWVFTNWLRILEFLGGAVLGVFGLVLLGKAGAKEV